VLAQRFADVGLAPFTATSVAERTQEVTVTMHLLDRTVAFFCSAVSAPSARAFACLTSVAGQNWLQVTPLGKHTSPVGVVWASERESFFMGTFELSAEEVSIASAKRVYGDVVDELEVAGSHTPVCARCLIGDVPAFNEWFCNLLANL
jgi:hypothetical protein